MSLSIPRLYVYRRGPGRGSRSENPMDFYAKSENTTIFFSKYESDLEVVNLPGPANPIHFCHKSENPTMFCNKSENPSIIFTKIYFRDMTNNPKNRPKFRANPKIRPRFRANPTIRNPPSPFRGKLIPV